MKRRGRTLTTLIIGLYIGIAIGWWVRATVEPDDEPAAVLEPAAEATTGNAALRPATGAAAIGIDAATARPTPAPSARASSGTSGASNDAVAELRRHDLGLPIDEADVKRMEGGFAQRRGGGSRGHEAVDILAPRHTPVRAVEDGTIARLFSSKAGGITLYQFDPGGRFCYYYAHLERYAPGLEEGMKVSKGDVIGYVGTTGNAPPNTPHLHFAIFELTDAKRWWEGRPIDPYLVYQEDIDGM